MRATFMKLSPWLAAGAGVLAACSGASSGNGGTTAGASTSGAAASSCPSTNAFMLSSACVPCLGAHCNAEQSAYAGPNWATESYGAAGGACADYFMCIGKCGCDGKTCPAGCPMSADCMSAESAAGSCSTQYCSSDCAGSLTSVSGGVCVAMNGATCPTAGLIGCCKTASQEVCVYPPQTAANGMQICSDGSGGTWSATP